MSQTALLLCRDLIFTSKITGTGRALGWTVKVAPSGRQALSAVDAETALALVDLSAPADPSNEELRALKEKLPANAKLVAFGSHVDVERLRGAREAGCDSVLPRSAFVEQLAGMFGQR